MEKKILLELTEKELEVIMSAIYGDTCFPKDKQEYHEGELLIHKYYDEMDITELIEISETVFSKLLKSKLLKE